MSQTIYYFSENRNRESNLAAAFNKRSVPEVNTAYLIKRSYISKKIKQILCLSIDYNSYDMIVGYQGTGKTTLVRHIGHKHPGIIYVNVEVEGTNDNLFSHSFAEALNWVPYRCSFLEAVLSIQTIAFMGPNSGMLFTPSPQPIASGYNYHINL